MKVCTNELRKGNHKLIVTGENLSINHIDIRTTEWWMTCSLETCWFFSLRTMKTVSANSTNLEKKKTQSANESVFDKIWSCGSVDERILCDSLQDQVLGAWLDVKNISLVIQPDRQSCHDEIVTNHQLVQFHNGTHWSSLWMKFDLERKHLMIYMMIFTKVITEHSFQTIRVQQDKEIILKVS